MPARLVVCCAVSFAFLGMTVTAGERRVKDVSGRREILSLNVGNTDRHTHAGLAVVAHCWGPSFPY